MVRHANAVPPWTCDCPCHQLPPPAEARKDSHRASQDCGPECRPCEDAKALGREVTALTAQVQGINDLRSKLGDIDIDGLEKRISVWDCEEWDVEEGKKIIELLRLLKTNIT